MTERQVSEGLHAIIKLAAKEAAEQAIKNAKEVWREDISTHSFQCEAKKFTFVKNFTIGGLGGIIVVVFKWLFGKV